MKPKRIILIRHGKSQSNQCLSILKAVPDYAVELTPEGRAQAYQAGKKIRELIGTETVKFYISPFWRTRQTYLEVRKNLSQVGFQEDPRIREQEFHTRLSAEDFVFPEEERDAYSTFYYRPLHGESAADCFDRTSDFIGSLFRDFEKEGFADNCVIITHGLLIRVFLMRFLKLTVEEFEVLANPQNCEFYILELQENKKYKLITELRKHAAPKHKFIFDWSK